MNEGMENLKEIEELKEYKIKYKKLERAVKKFLGNYVWANCEMAEDRGIGVGYFNDEDKPEHVLQVDKLYEMMD